jgi:hypothetical protein
MESAEQLGYEVRVYARVPEIGERQHPAHNGEVRKLFPVKTHTRQISSNGGGATSTESETSASASASTSTRNAPLPQAFPVERMGDVPLSVFSSSNAQLSPSVTTQSSSSSGTSGSTRVRYREQGVDELLQLKLHQAIADVDDPPADATIVLATGDGGAGQFSEQGFLGPVRTALKKGWRVELYAWEEGLSRAWMREFGEGPYRDRFRIIGLEQFGQDLMEV